jgi:diguanylate cyclase (GGDEF)-like protein
MPFITLKRYLLTSEREVPLRSIISLLLKGLAAHAVRTDETEYEAFRADIERVESAVHTDTTDQLLIAAGAAVQAFESYNQHTARLIRRQAAELQHIASMLAQTLITISEGSDRSVQALHDITVDLEQAAALEDVQKVRLRLGDCLGRVREEAARQKKETETTILALQDHIARTGGESSPDVDPVTGLPKREAAESAFAELARTGGRKYLVTVVIDRLQSINNRFGNAVGDQVLKIMAEYVAQHLGADGLFRWSGPALVAILRRQESIDRVRTEMKRIIDVRLDKLFDLGGRSALVPITVSWSVIGLVPPATIASKHIDGFVASQMPRDYC